MRHSKSTKVLVKHKQRNRRVCYKNKDNGNDNRKIITKNRTPSIKNVAPIFAIFKTNTLLTLAHHIQNFGVIYHKIGSYVQG